MNIRAALVTVVGLAIIAGIVYAVATPAAPAPVPVQENTNNGTDQMPVSQENFYTNEKYGISFRYPDSYELTGHLGEGSAMRERYSITLIRNEDLPPPQGGEGPPAITIDIFQNNLDNLSTEGWIRNSSFSNYKLSSNDGILASTTISGKPALSYRWSGLYEGTTIAIAEPDWVYAFTVTYIEMGEDIVQDFVKVRDSVRLTD